MLLTTHYLDEAESTRRSRLPFSAQARSVAIGRPADLTGETPATRDQVPLNGEEMSVSRTSPHGVLHELTSQALAEGRGLRRRSAAFCRPTLEEQVYLALTGVEETSA